ncbi:hypothetical protein K9M78_05965 [Candidatus Bipolaricaulota bacterium]|nr:hypothetical protein [Candidatus Bipolaricaulota bacterium]
MSWFFRNVIVVLGLAVGAFILSLLLVKLLWVWTIPDLFPRAVEEGFIARNISWFASLKSSNFLLGLNGSCRRPWN